MSYYLGGLNAQFGPTYQVYRSDESWYLRAGRRSLSHTRRQDSGFGSRCRYTTLWPASRLQSGDRTADFGMFGDDWGDPGGDFYESWSPWQRSLRGNGRAAQFTPGYTYNDVGGILGGAEVQIFLTSNDAYVGNTFSDNNGWYQAWSVYPGQQHYFVAYAPGSPDVAGTTVRTLTPT